MSRVPSNYGPNNSGGVSESSDSGSASNESSSGSDSSGSEEESSSEEEQVLLKPVFLSKSQRARKNERKDVESGDPMQISDRQKQVALSKLEQSTKNSSLQDTEENDFDGIDDTDDLEPEKEFEDWKSRELARFYRDRELWRQEEAIVDERIRRENMTEEQLEEDFKKRQSEKSQKEENVKESKSYYHKGAFFHDDEEISEKFLKRDYTEVDENGDLGKDHSRPTKLKFKKQAQ
ncbi:micro-fibrillar-associated protein 1 [Scheffersomyces xylosifermentans]|uniref:micro-fibrillar-associated protein 1 n=1 Tax=Scheffersomyces xylosifermentans TaxID=1304137 RepID=UPI00315D243F